MKRHAHPHKTANVQGSRLRVVPAPAGLVELTLPGPVVALGCECGEVDVPADGGLPAPVPCLLHPSRETVSALAEHYTRQVDELAGTVEHCMAQMRVVSEALGELHVVLDGIGHVSRRGRTDA